jgi:hypothetical protein
MKVLITYTETITRELVQEVEMTRAEYNKYLKMSNFEKEQEYDLCARCSDEHFVDLDYRIDVEIVKAKNKK